jgi:hypothetical protein
MGFMKGILGVLSLAAPALAAQAAQVCNLALQACPKTLEGSTIDVPENVIWLDPKLPFCNEQVQVQTGGNAAPPSIVFIIDNSASMNTEDPDEARFTVVRSLLDTIYRASPNAEVGLVIFTSRLQFDHRDNTQFNTYFKTAFPDDSTQHDSFVPLTPLDKTFTRGTETVLGLDTLKALLAYRGNGDLDYATNQPPSRTRGGGLGGAGGIRYGTDITLGFEAAKVAMRDARAARQDQYFIFLSDGEPLYVDQERESVMMDFQNGANTPTTFTVFFKTNGPLEAPQTIATMTGNIRNNGYSPSNSKSAHWAIDIPGSQLMDLMRSNILTPIFANRPATPSSATLTSGGATLSNSSKDAGNFIFPDRVPLAPNQTQVALTYTYEYADSGKTKQHVATYNVNIRRVSAATPPAGTATLCKEQGDIELFHGGRKIEIVTADHALLETRLTLPSGEVCTGCKVTVQPGGNRGGADRESVAVAPIVGSIYSGVFGREVLTGGNRVVPGDGKLQHGAADSIVVTWVNPRNPLDVVRKAFPYSNVKTTLLVGNHNTYSMTDPTPITTDRRHWVLVNPVNILVTADPGSNHKVVPGITPEDSLKYVGIKVTASRSFRAEIKVYSNLGHFVNKLAFSVPQEEFLKLPADGTGGDRSLLVLWDNRAADGSFAGTGAYVMKTTVTLNKIPGLAEDEVARTDYRRVGVVRNR